MLGRMAGNTLHVPHTQLRRGVSIAHECVIRITKASESSVSLFLYMYS